MKQVFHEKEWSISFSHHKSNFLEKYHNKSSIADNLAYFQKKHLNETLKGLFHLNQFKQPSPKRFFVVNIFSLNKPIDNWSWENAMFVAQNYSTDSVFISRELANIIVLLSYKRKTMILNNKGLSQNNCLN